MGVNIPEIPEEEKKMQEEFEPQDREMWSAKTIAEHIICKYFKNINSVADFWWRWWHFIKAILDKYEEIGKKWVIGVSIDQLPYSEKMYIPEDNYLQADITDVKLENPADLVMCIETAEHIEKDLAEELVKNLCNNSNWYVLFSAAFPGQWWYCHVNEQPAEYWEKIFEKYWYEKHDCIRSRLLPHEKDDLQYRYLPNMYLYVKKGKDLPEGLTDDDLPFYVPDELYKKRLEKNPQSVRPQQRNGPLYTSSQIYETLKWDELKWNTPIEK